MCQKMVLTFWQNFRQIYPLVLELSTKNRKPKSEYRQFSEITENFRFYMKAKFFFFNFFFLNAKKITESEFFFFYL